MFNLLHIRQFFDCLIVTASEPVHHTVLFAAGLDADDNLIALFPFMDIFWDHLHRVLEICHHFNNAVARHLKHPIIRRVELAEITCIKNRLNPWIG